MKISELLWGNLHRWLLCINQNTNTNFSLLANFYGWLIAGSHLLSDNNSASWNDPPNCRTLYFIEQYIEDSGKHSTLSLRATDVLCGDCITIWFLFGACNGLPYAFERHQEGKCWQITHAILVLLLTIEVISNYSIHSSILLVQPLHFSFFCRNTENNKLFFFKLDSSIRVWTAIAIN